MTARTLTTVIHVYESTLPARMTSGDVTLPCLDWWFPGGKGYFHHGCPDFGGDDMHDDGSGLSVRAQD